MSASAYQGVLFDLDGTLLDTAPDLGLAANVALAQYGFPPISAVTASQVSSHGAAGLLRAGLGAHYDRTDIMPLRTALLDSYADNICIGTSLYDGVAELIEWLDEEGIPWGIVTNKPAWLTTPLLKHFPQFSNRSCTVSGDTCGVAKPDPKPMHFAAQQIGVAESDILYVGDAQRDVEAGKSSGMDTVAALWGYIRPQDHPQQWLASHDCRTVNDLLSLLKSK
ncbi:HAD family hydrolase [Ferrimonas lipolytica]|uniref:HAD-IA family hydrolase n=1 Tax=Ferrimonas lipolytica TaxID=2724191 RepID=A0A6H1UBZ7_9GAMM|nr:HAD-IA family hydrolase [Ferrimonas lipolytica]QIZ76617.1 HAD-IA family hydrolase [Ferrimonas lipolytica]